MCKVLLKCELDRMTPHFWEVFSAWCLKFWMPLWHVRHAFLQRRRCLEMEFRKFAAGLHGILLNTGRSENVSIFCRHGFSWHIGSSCHRQIFLFPSRPSQWFPFRNHALRVFFSANIHKRVPGKASGLQEWFLSIQIAWLAPQNLTEIYDSCFDIFSHTKCSRGGFQKYIRAHPRSFNNSNSSHRTGQFLPKQREAVSERGLFSISTSAVSDLQKILHQEVLSHSNIFQKQNKGKLQSGSSNIQQLKREGKCFLGPLLPCNICWRFKIQNQWFTCGTN